MDDMRKTLGEGEGVEANLEEEEVIGGDDDMGRYGRCDNVGRLLGQGGGDYGRNNKKIRGHILSIPSLRAFIASLFKMTTGS